MAEHDGAAPTIGVTSSNNLSVPGGAVEFDAVEHPLELELGSEINFDDDEERDDADDSDGSEEGEAERQEAEYMFRFRGEMDPFLFAEDQDACGLQPYERFERMQDHYEEQTVMKRPALQQCSSTQTICPDAMSIGPNTSRGPAKRLREEEAYGASFEELMETMNYGVRKRSRKNKAKHRGRRKGSKKKMNSEVTRKLGDATLHYAHCRFEDQSLLRKLIRCKNKGDKFGSRFFRCKPIVSEFGEQFKQRIMQDVALAINVLKEVIRLAPNLSDPYHTLGLIYTEMNDKKRALNFYMIAAHLIPKDSSLWKLLVSRSIEQGDKRQANYCLNKAIIADPEDIGLKFHRASLYVELGEYHKAADAHEQISNLCPDDNEVLTKATELHRKCGQCEQAVSMLEGNLKKRANDAKVVDLLALVLMECNEYARALEHIEHTQQRCCSIKEIPLDLNIKAGICHAHLGRLETAEAYFNVLKPRDAFSHPHLIVDVADSLMNAEQYESSLKYYFMLEEEAKNNGYLHLKIGKCYHSLGKRPQAIEYYYKAIQKLDDSVDARLILSSLLLEEDRSDEAISILSPPPESDLPTDTTLDTSKLWWRSGKIKLKLSRICKAKGSIEAFVDALFPLIRETMFLETVQQKVKNRKRLSISVLSERVKVLDEHQSDNVFHRFRPVASSADLSKASRAKKLLQKKAAEKEAKRVAELDAGFDWNSEDSDDEGSARVRRRKPPLPDFLKEDENHLLIVELCKSLSSLRRYWDALEIINLSLKLECFALPEQTKEELRTLGAQMAYNLADPKHGWDYVRYIVSHHPYSLSAWNCYYKWILRSNRFSKHNKFIHTMRMKHKDSVPPILISAHQFTMISQHQAAAREYLEAHKLMPDNPLINLCVGTALINLALGHRLQNKHQTISLGIAFLNNNLRLSKDSQEALYNIARAYHHVGFVFLAARYYEKVLALYPKDCPIPVLPNENPVRTNAPGVSGYCNLRREAAYNLHLIYKAIGALDLARQILKDHIVF